MMLIKMISNLINDIILINFVVLMVFAMLSYHFLIVFNDYFSLLFLVIAKLIPKTDKAAKDGAPKYMNL